MSKNTSGITLGLCLEPLDVLFFRDGKPFMTGTELMVSGLPLPQTVTGAIRTAILRAVGCDFEKLGEAIRHGKSFPEAVRKSCEQEFHWIGELVVRGPWLARYGNGTSSVEVLVPAPANLHREKDQWCVESEESCDPEPVKSHPEKDQPGRLCRLFPLLDDLLPGWSPPGGQQRLRPLWLHKMVPTEPVSGFLTPAGLARFLRASDPAPQDIVSPEKLFGWDYRIGIGIAPDRLVAQESQIFGRGFLTLQKGVVFYAELIVPEHASVIQILDQIKIFPLGGETRQVILHRVDPFRWPEITLADGQKPLVLLTTPCVFEAGWKPRVLDTRLVSAAVPEPLAFSGWDLARGGPKPTRFAVPAGSVYFLDSLPPLPLQTLAETDEDHRQGWGCALIGAWSYE